MNHTKQAMAQPKPLASTVALAKFLWRRGRGGCISEDDLAAAAENVVMNIAIERSLAS
jgi:hypothetical protein